MSVRQQLAYPSTRRDRVVETLHGREIADPYRWLEDPDSPETIAWVAAQNALTESWMTALPGREWFAEIMRSVVRRRGPAYLSSEPADTS